MASVHAIVKERAIHRVPRYDRLTGCIAVTSIHLLPAPAGEAVAQDRPTAAPPPRPLPLGTRLALSVALSVAAIITVLTLAGTWIARRQLDGDLRETARVTAVALADDIELRQDPWSAEALVPVLRDFMNAGGDLRAISVFRSDAGTAVPVVSTSVVLAPPPEAVQAVISSGEPEWRAMTPQIAMLVVPVNREETVTGAVAVAVSLAAIEQLQQTTGLVAIGGAAFAIAAITLMIHLLARRLVLEPLGEIRRVTARGRTGDLAARARVTRPVEMREVADGLNAMLSDLDDLHHSLRERVEAATSELRDRNEQLERSYESVSQLRETAARAQQMAAVGQTLANVAHQVGTPLNLISGHVQILRQDIADPSMQRRLRIVEQQAERMAAVVRELLERARPDAERRPVRIEQMLATIGDAMRVRLAPAGVKLVLRVGAAAPPVAADEAQLELALLNVVTNAVDAMPGGGTLTLGADATPNGVRIEVRDTGAGIDAALLPKIFDPWITTKPAGRGTGLGLSITRDVIRSLGGTIGVVTAAGEGTTFTIDLPAAETARAAS
jgi:two-component system, NtrC family, sensor kinase